MDLLITENVFYGRDAQVGTAAGAAAQPCSAPPPQQQGRQRRQQHQHNRLADLQDRRRVSAAWAPQHAVGQLCPLLFVPGP